MDVSSVGSTPTPPDGGRRGMRIKIGKEKPSVPTNPGPSGSFESFDSASRGAGIALSGVGLVLALGGVSLLTHTPGQQLDSLPEAILQGAKLLGGPETERAFRENNRFVGAAFSIPGTVSYYSGRRMMGEDERNDLIPPS